MAVTPGRVEIPAGVTGRRDWLLPVLGTAASLAFAAALSTALRILRGFARAREAAFDPPQAILILGGDKERESLAAKFVASCGERSFTRLVKPEAHASGLRLLPVYVSSGHDDVAGVMLRAGVHASRLRIDNRALDTVTNFTSMLSTFLKAQYSHVYVVTSDYHRARASLVATLVLCSHGIAYTAVVLPSASGKEVTKDLGTRERKSQDTSRKAPTRQGRRLADASTSKATESHPASSAESTAVDSGESLPGQISFEDSTSSNSSSLSTTKSGLRKPSSLPKDFLSEPSVTDGETSSEIEHEGWVRRERDRVRVLLWLLTGWHGAELLRFTRPQRYRLHKQKPLHPDIPVKEE